MKDDATSFDPLVGVRLLEELVPVTALPSALQDACARALPLIAAALGARSASVLPPGEGEPIAFWGARPGPPARRAADAAIAGGVPRFEPSGSAGLLRSALPLRGAGDGKEAFGALVIERASRWSPEARTFLESAARALAGALLATTNLRSSQEQGELLARRNVELEALHELGTALAESGSDEEALQAALDLVLRRLGLQAGWIFWGQSRTRTLELAASRGVAEEFVRRSRESGIGTCLCQDVFATGHLRVARNTLDCPRLPELLHADQPMTHACIPLKFERGIMGVMNIANRPGSVFAPSELQFLEIVGNQLCLAIDKMRSARAENQHNAEARALSALERAIGGSLDLDKVLEAVGDYARELLTAERCALFLGDGQGPLHLAYLAGPLMEGIEVGQPVDLEKLGSRAIPMALAERRMIVVHDAMNDPRVGAEAARRWSIRSGIAAPLLSGDRVEGVLLTTRSRAIPWSDEEIDLVNALARHAALAIENARLYREAQEGLLALQQAQFGMMRAERLAAVGTLAASLAHEVRNPLNSIHLQLVLLTRRVAALEAPSKAEMGTLVTTAQKEIARLDALVEDFLSLSAVDRLTLAETDPNRPIHDVLTLMSPVAAQKKTTIVENLSRDLPRIPLDSEKMRQVLINLVRNALDAMPDGGTLTIGSSASSDGVLLSIADTGCGIDQALDVFDLFMTTKRGGTGLGLPIARRIVEAHGGSLTFESAPDKGTTFYIALSIP